MNQNVLPRPGVLLGRRHRRRGGMLEEAALDDVVADAIERLVLGLRPRAA